MQKSARRVEKNSIFAIWLKCVFSWWSTVCKSLKMQMLVRKM